MTTKSSSVACVGMYGLTYFITPVGNVEDTRIFNEYNVVITLKKNVSAKLFPSVKPTQYQSLEMLSVSITRHLGSATGSYDMMLGR